MAYTLNRDDGKLVKKIALKIPRSDEKVTGEVRLHPLSAGDIPAVWYCFEGEWKIFVAGETAKRFMQ